MPTIQFHTPVLLHEVLSFLVTAPDGTYVDATLGGAGHAEALLRRLGPSGRLIGIDADADALAFAAERLKPFEGRCTTVHRHFGDLRSILEEVNTPMIDGILFDLGVSSFQLDESTKGFSFRSNERLDMRMDRTAERDAVAVLNTSSEEELARVFYEYGEEHYSRRIARTIVEQRTRSRIETTGQLSEIIEHTVGQRFLVKSLARVFQAIRIEVNHELEQLENGLSDALDALRSGGRLVVISYHSLEDRIVKRFFRAASATVIHSGTKLLPDRTIEPRMRILTRKPVESSSQEKKDNPRARSAKLRAAERL